MSGFTPGPWSIESPMGNIRAAVAPPRSGQAINSHLLMAVTDNGTSYEERIANARLIASAPCLLDALIELAESAEEAWGADRPCVREAFAAIRKATGAAE